MNHKRTLCWKSIRQTAEYDGSSTGKIVFSWTKKMLPWYMWLQT